MQVIPAHLVSVDPVVDGPLHVIQEGLCAAAQHHSGDAAQGRILEVWEWGALRCEGWEEGDGLRHGWKRAGLGAAPQHYNGGAAEGGTLG